MIAILEKCILFILINVLYKAYAIDCFKCISLNNDNKACDDPFHNNYTLDILESPCMGGRKGRDGLFPATSCIKIAGVFDDNADTITVRGCALDSGTLTTDTEIVRMSHCGGFYYEDRYVRGCLQSCNDADACNSTQYSKHITMTMTPLYLFFLALFCISWIKSHFMNYLTVTNRNNKENNTRKLSGTPSSYKVHSILYILALVLIKY